MKLDENICSAYLMQFLGALVVLNYPLIATLVFLQKIVTFQISDQSDVLKFGRLENKKVSSPS